MKRWGIIGVLLICLALVSLPACGRSGDENGAGQTPDGTSGVAPEVTVSGDGTVAALNDRDLAFSVAGKLDELYVNEGDTVGKGTTLAKLDTTALELALAGAEADLVQAQANLLQATATRDQANYDWYQYKKIYHASSDRIKVAASQLEAAEAQIEAAEMQVQVAERAVTEARWQLGEATLTAPFDGEVADVSIDEGDSIIAGTTVIRMVDPAGLQLIARINELDIVLVKTGQRVRIGVDALPDTTFEGSVTFISPVPRESGAILFEDEDEEKEYEVTIDLYLPENSTVRVGMNAVAEIIIE